MWDLSGPGLQPVSLALAGGLFTTEPPGRPLLWLLSLRSLGSGMQAQWWWPTGLVAPWLVDSSQTRDQTHGPCIAKQILNHLTSREVPVLLNTFCLILWLLYCLSFAFYLTRSSLREVIIVFIFVFLPQNLLLLEHVSFICCVRLYKLGINSTANKVKHTTMA